MPVRLAMNLYKQDEKKDRGVFTTNEPIFEGAPGKIER